MSNATNQNELWVTGFGTGKAFLNGQDLNLTPDSVIHDFLFYMLEHPIAMRQDYLAAIWSRLDPEAAIANFHVMRANLDDLFNLNVLQSQDNHYQLNPNLSVKYDVDAYTTYLDEITYGVPNELVHYQAAYNLYRHDFLIQSKSSWIVKRRQELKLLQSDVCYQMARQHGLTINSIGLLSKSFYLNPYREDVVHDMMTIYISQNLPCDALDVYNALHQNLQTVGIHTPNKKLLSLKQQAEVSCP